MERTRSGPARRFRRLFWTISAVVTVGSTALAVYVGMVLMNVVLVLSLVTGPATPPVAQAPISQSAVRNG